MRHAVPSVRTWRRGRGTERYAVGIVVVRPRIAVRLRIVAAASDDLVGDLESRRVGDGREDVDVAADVAGHIGTLAARARDQADANAAVVGPLLAATEVGIARPAAPWGSLIAGEE